MARWQEVLRSEVRQLARLAFQQHLISGYGDSEYADQFQIIAGGKTTHLPLEQIRTLLWHLLNWKACVSSTSESTTVFCIHLYQTRVSKNRTVLNN